MPFVMQEVARARALLEKFRPEVRLTADDFGTINDMLLAAVPSIAMTGDWSGEDYDSLIAGAWSQAMQGNTAMSWLMSAADINRDRDADHALLTRSPKGPGNESEDQTQFLARVRLLMNHYKSLRQGKMAARLKGLILELEVRWPGPRMKSAVFFAPVLAAAL
jgi:hypothetical protein